MKYLIAIIIIAGILSAVGYFVYTDLQASPVPPPVAGSAVSVFSDQVAGPEPKSAEADTAEPSSGARPIPAGAQEYRSRGYGFSLFYPQELSGVEHDDGGGASTITFQNVEKAQGFQIFIVPYREAQVSEERFRQDVPSGVRQALTDITVDGVAGAAFDSTDTALGATREIWFVHGGYLYEVTTLKPLDSWLSGIIQTWKFD